MPCLIKIAEAATACIQRTMAHCTYMPALWHWKPNSSEQSQHKRCSDNSNAASELACCPAIFLPSHSILVCWPCLSHLQCTLILLIAFLPFFEKKLFYLHCTQWTLPPHPFSVATGLLQSPIWFPFLRFRFHIVYLFGHLLRSPRVTRP